MPRRRLLVALCLAAIALRGAGAQGWSTAPLRAATPTPRDGLPPTRDAFNAWLRTHGDSLTVPQARAARERLHAYLSGEAKVRGGALPGPLDSAAIGTFALAARLGDPGALLVTQQWTGLKPPWEIRHRGMSVRFEPPYLVASGKDELWRVCYPFFFMTELVGFDVTAQQVATETVILSTLVAPDKLSAGASAAHVFIAAAAPADSAAFVREAVVNFGLEPMGPTETRGAWYHGPAASPLPSVAVVRRLPQRVVLMVYTGARGTFEVNRPHFETLVARLGTGACAP
jgi:hypothetical protein